MMKTTADASTVRASLWEHATRKDMNARLTVSLDVRLPELAWLKDAYVKVEASPSFLMVTLAPEAEAHGRVTLADHAGRFPDNFELNISGGVADELRTMFGAWGKTAMGYLSGSDMLFIELPKDRPGIIRRPRRAKDVEAHAEVIVVEPSPGANVSLVLARSVLSKYGDPDAIIKDKALVLAALAAIG